MSLEKTPEEWVADYGARHPTYVEYAGRVEALIRDLLKQEAIDVIQVESRAKTVASFGEKIRRKGRSDDNPFESVTDLIGIRVITYYLDDVTLVGELIEREFRIDADNSMDKAESLASDQFGYRSAHYVTRLDPARAKLVEWRSFAGIPVEFQVRTSLQHAWAAVSHKLDYKSAQEAPTSLRRQLFRLSALFELADEQFSALRDQRAATLTAYDEDVSEGRLDEVPIDTSSLPTYWNSSDTGARFQAELAQLNTLLVDDADVDEGRRAMDRQDLVRTSREFGISTLAQLDGYLASARVSHIAQALAEYRTEFGPELREGRIAGSIDDIVTMIMLIDHGKVEEIGTETYIPTFRKHLKSVQSNIEKEG